MHPQQFPQISQHLVNPNASTIPGVLPEEAQVAARNLDAVGYLAGDSFQIVPDGFQLFAFNHRFLANALVDELEQTGDDGQGGVNVMDDAGVDLSASAN